MPAPAGLFSHSLCEPVELIVVQQTQGPVQIGRQGNPRQLPASDSGCRPSRHGLLPLHNPRLPLLALDVDVILAARAAMLTGMRQPGVALVATSNVDHLDQFVTARLWQDIH